MYVEVAAVEWVTSDLGDPVFWRRGKHQRQWTAPDRDGGLVTEELSRTQKRSVAERLYPSFGDLPRVRVEIVEIHLDRLYTQADERGFEV